MHLTGSAALWYQTVQSAILAMNWDDFCATVCAKFDRDEHNHLLRHFFHICQTHLVHEYIEQFCDLVHQILAHDLTFSKAIIINRFVDGLKKEIKSVVMMHSLKTWTLRVLWLCCMKKLCWDQPTIARGEKLFQASRKLLKTIQGCIQQDTLQDTHQALEKKREVLKQVKARLGKIDYQLSSLSGSLSGYVSSVVRSGIQAISARMSLFMLWRKCGLTCLMISLKFKHLLRRKMILKKT